MPLGLVGIALVTLFFDNPKEEAPRPLDWIGFLLTGAALFCIMYGVEALGRSHNELTEAIVLLGGGFALGALALRHLRRAKHPVLDLSVFRIPTFKAGIYGGSAFRCGGGTLVFLLPLLLQVVFGLSAAVSGSITFATAVGSMSMKVAGPRIIGRFGFRNVILVNGVISAATIAMCAFFTAATPLWLIFVLLLVAGFFQSLQFTATQAIGYADVQQRQMSTATSIASMAQQLSRGFGISIVAVHAASVGGLARRQRARPCRFHRRLRRRGDPGAVLPALDLVAAARCRGGSKRPSAQSSRLTGLLGLS